MSKILLFDNYDSFTYNLHHALERCETEVVVVRNNELVDVSAEGFDAVCLSPGPGLPSEAGKLRELIQVNIGKAPILGVCLGMQALAEHLGAKLYNLGEVKHGVTEKINLQDSVLFDGLDEQIEVGLYHSWAVEENSCFLNGFDGCKVTAVSLNGVVMAIENPILRCWGVQFHPESVMTPAGLTILKNFVDQIN